MVRRPWDSLQARLPASWAAGWFYRDSGLSASDIACEADRFASQVPRGKLCMAAIQEHLLRHRRTPEVAAHEVIFEEVSTDANVPAVARGLPGPVGSELQESR
jgi:hypothetical protein